MAPHVAVGSLSTEALGSAARPTSASPRKLTSGPNEKFVAMGHKQTFGEKLRRDFEFSVVGEWLPIKSYRSVFCPKPASRARTIA